MLATLLQVTYSHVRLMPIRKQVIQKIVSIYPVCLPSCPFSAIDT